MTYIYPRCLLCLTSGCTGQCNVSHSNLLWPAYEPMPPDPNGCRPAGIAKGCICPPGSEATCRRSDCGRKDAKSQAA